MNLGFWAQPSMTIETVYLEVCRHEIRRSTVSCNAPTVLQYSWRKDATVVGTGYGIDGAQAPRRIGSA